MNLPHSQRFKFENIIPGGIIPSLESEPELHTFLEPCVDELHRLSASLSPVPLKIVAALLCVAADIPATCKLCGFVGHSANRACSKCFKIFAGGVRETKDFSGFQQCSSWPKRDGVSHKRNCERLKAANSQSEYGRLSSLYGVHYSALCKHEYFVCVLFHIIDPMHNLLLGTAHNVFSKVQLKDLSKEIDDLNTATFFGRIPRKIGTNYGNYIAEDWKNWTITFSMYALYGILLKNKQQLLRSLSMF